MERSGRSKLVRDPASDSMGGSAEGLNVEMDNKVSTDPFSMTCKEVVGGTDHVPSRDHGHQIGRSDLMEEDLGAELHENDGRRSDVDISKAGRVPRRHRPAVRTTC